MENMKQDLMMLGVTIDEASLMHVLLNAIGKIYIDLEQQLA
jgi:hypothetical protein